MITATIHGPTPPNDRVPRRAQGGEPPRVPALDIRTILFPTDFTEESREAFRYALELARRWGAEVQLVHVLNNLEGDAFSVLRYSPEAAAEHATPDQLIYRHLEAMIDGENVDGVRVEPVKMRGRAVAPAIVDYAAKTRADVIVVGMHDVHGLRQLVHGTIAEAIVYRAPCHVIAVPDGDPGRFLPVERILAPTDYSASAQAAVAQAIVLADAWNARLDLMHVIEPLPLTAAVTGLMTMNDVMPDVRRQAARALEKAGQAAQASDVETVLHLDEGSAATRIVERASESDADLVVMSSHGVTGLGRYLLGSVTERVVRSAQCPVFVLRQPDATA